MKIILATWPEFSQGVSLTKFGYQNRLLSYYFLKDVARKGWLEIYTTTGVQPVDKGLPLVVSHEGKRLLSHRAFKLHIKKEGK
jgi:hypothetical protein